MNNETIVHVIDSLGRGGAESLLKGSVPLLSSYQHIVVYLYEANEEEGDDSEGYQKFCLNLNSRLDLFNAVIKLRKIINKNKAALVHSHLFWSTIISRLAVPDHVKLISSYHSLLYEPSNSAQYSRKMLLLDRLTYRKRYNTIVVSETVEKHISETVKIKNKLTVLHNFIEDAFFVRKEVPLKVDSGKLKIVATGNLRPEKNYLFIIQALSSLSHADVELHIYGKGKQEEMIAEKIQESGLSNVVILKGQTNRVEEVLRNYDLYISGSRFEGFGIAVAEAMATGLPCLLSRIPAHLEVAGDSALYFDPLDSVSLVNQLHFILKNHAVLLKFRDSGRERAKMFNKADYLSKLFHLYQKQIRS